MAALFAVALVDADLASPLTWILAILAAAVAAAGAWHFSARFERPESGDERPLPPLIYPVNGVIPEAPDRPAPSWFSMRRAVPTFIAFVLLTLSMLESRREEDTPLA